MDKLDFSRHPGMNNFMGFMRKINSAIGLLHGNDRMIKGIEFDESNAGQTFKIEDKNSKFNGRDIVINSTVPSQEMFSLAQELVRPADEPFAAREVFAVDESFHEGSQEIGYDVIAERGRALLVAAGNSTGNNTPKADVSVGRKLNTVGKIQNYMEVSRDELQAIDLRNDRGLGPLVDLISEKLNVARKNILRLEDQVAWQGSNFADTEEVNEIPGFFDSLSNDTALNEGTNPSKGRREDIQVPLWTDPAKTADQYIADIRKAAEYITRNGVYVPDTMAVPRDILTTISLRRTSDTDSTPLIEWIKRAFAAAYNIELKIVGTNALKTLTGGSNNGFLLLDSKKEYQAISGVEALTVLPSVVKEDGTIRQFVLMKTGGTMVKHPAAAYLGTNI